MLKFNSTLCCRLQYCQRSKGAFFWGYSGYSYSGFGITEYTFCLFCYWVTCDRASFFRRSAKEKQCETRRSVGGQSDFYSEARKSTPDTFTARVVCRQSRIWTFVWLVEKQESLTARSNWLHDCMFDFRCNFT